MELDGLEAIIDAETDIEKLKQLSLRLSELESRANRRIRDLSVDYYEVYAEGEYIDRFDTIEEAHAECKKQMLSRFGGIGSIQDRHYFPPNSTFGSGAVVSIQRMTKDDYWVEKL